MDYPSRGTARRQAASTRARRGAPLALVAAALMAFSAPAASLASNGKWMDHKPAGAGSGKRIR